MITSITIENFKGISQAVTIPLKPITLLFGKNSAGKSTILQALHYAREILENHNLDPDSTALGGEGADLGGFDALVHGHKVQRRIRLRFDLDLKSVDLNKILPLDEFIAEFGTGSPLLQLDLSQVGSNIQSAWLALEVGHRDWHNRSLGVLTYEIGLDGELLGRIECFQDTPGFVPANANLTYFNVKHPVIAWPEEGKGHYDLSCGPIDIFFPQIKTYLERIFFRDEEYGVLTEEEGPAWLEKRAGDSDLTVFTQAPVEDFEPEALRCVAISCQDAPDILDDSASECFEVWMGFRNNSGELGIQSVEFQHDTGWNPKKSKECFEAWLAKVADDNAHFVPLMNTVDACPNFELGFSFMTEDQGFESASSFASEDLDDNNFQYEFLKQGKTAAQRLVSRLMLIPAICLRKTLDSIRYIGPIREIPVRNHVAPRTSDPSRWANGLAAWDALMNAPAGSDLLPTMTAAAQKDKPAIERSLLVENVNEYLRDVLKLGYQIDRYEYNEVPSEVMAQLQHMAHDFEDMDQSEFLARVIHPLMKSPLKQGFRLYDEKNKVHVAPADVGVGVSQAVPVVVGAVAEGYSLLAVEQPELHLHPAAQCEMGDLFIREALHSAYSGRMMLIETHSEHLLLRIMKRMRQTATGSLPEGSLPVRQEDVMVLYVEPDGSRSIVREMPLNERGELVKAWPGGFFEESFEELF
jgi:AAA ATPase domain